MTEKTKDVSDAADKNPVGDDGLKNDSTSGGDQTRDTVSYETHRRLLGEKKKLQDRLDEIERANKEKETQTLKEKEDYKKLYEQAEAEKKAKEQEIADWRKREEYSLKIGAFLDKLDGQLDRKYFVHVNRDKIIINPETGEPDDASVAVAVKEFKENFPELIRKQNGSTGLPKDSPKGDANGSITRAEWLKLSSKDMMKYKPDQIIN